MSDYKSDFDNLSNQIMKMIEEMPGDIGLELPGLALADVKRILLSISNSLLKIDKSSVRYPEHLMVNNGYLPAIVVDYFAAIQNEIPNGAQHFVRTILPRIVEYKEALQKAIGLEAAKVRTAVSNQLGTLDQILYQSQELLTKVDEVQKQTVLAYQEVGKIKSLSDQRLGDISASARAIETTRQQVERLAGDPVRKDSLSAIMKTVRQKSVELSKLSGELTEATQQSSDAANDAVAALSRIKEIEDGLSTIERQAGTILKGATQAGLAGAYTGERNRLAKEQNVSVVIFYLGIAAIVIYASVFILPVISKLMDDSDGEVHLGKVTIILLIRTALVAPIIWALVFTNSRFTKLELLQMDYAAKANTALAYAGYSEEIGADVALSARLKAGLLVRFLEHPERLFRKSALKEKVSAGPTGVHYESETAAHQNDDEFAKPAAA